MALSSQGQEQKQLQCQTKTRLPLKRSVDFACVFARIDSDSACEPAHCETRSKHAPRMSSGLDRTALSMRTRWWGPPAALPSQDGSDWVARWHIVALDHVRGSSFGNCLANGQVEQVDVARLLTAMN
jgi:hypothetical protein